MTRGYFIVVGDKTTCGGRVLTGSADYSRHGKPTARMGDEVLCGKDGKIYLLDGGIPNQFINGICAAGTLHTVSSCRCRAKIIPSLLDISYGYYSEATITAEPVQHAQAAKKSLHQTVEQALQESQNLVSAPPASTLKETPRKGIDAGFTIVSDQCTPNFYEKLHFPNSPTNAISLYHELNPDLVKKPGSILIVVDPLKQESEQIEHLKNARKKIDAALKPLTTDEASFLYKHRNVIDIFSSIGGDYSGLIAGMAKSYFSEIESILIKIQNAYRNQFITSGALIGEQFFIERRQLFAKLDNIFLKIFRQRIGLAPYDDLRRALRLSSSSIIHRWNQTGVSDIEGYATYIERSAKIVKMMNTLGKVGIGLSALNGANSIYDACTIHRDCEKTTFTEVGKFSGGVILPLVSAGIIKAGTTALCAVALGAISAPAGGAGALACNIIVSGVSGFAAGKVGESMGSYFGEKTYEIID